MSRSTQPRTQPRILRQAPILGTRRRDLRRFWILLPGLLMILVDLGLTLYSQPTGYWRTSYTLTTEESPLGMLLMRLHPVAFLGFMAGYITVCAALVLRLAPPWHKIISLALVLGHTAGAYSWLGDRAYWATMAGFIFVAAVTVFSWQRAGKDGGT